MKNNGETLHILWTNDNVLTTRLMVFMYATNSLRQGWWDEVHVMAWGPTVKLLAENETVQQQLKAFLDAGGHVSACKSCAEDLNVLDKLEALGGIEILYISEDFTRIIKDGEKLITI